MPDSECYPYKDSWPIEGFTMAENQFVQFRIRGPIVQARPPQKDYPPDQKGFSTRQSDFTYTWHEIHVSFNLGAPAGNPYANPDGKYAEVYAKSTRKLKPKGSSQCIARFQTREEAEIFMHKMHQSRDKSHKSFFNDVVKD